MTTDIGAVVTAFLEPAAEISQLKATVKQMAAFIKRSGQEVTAHKGGAAAANPGIGDLLRFDQDLRLNGTDERLESLDSFEDVPKCSLVPNAALLGVLVRAVQLRCLHEVRFRVAAIMSVGSGGDADGLAFGRAEVDGNTAGHPGVHVEDISVAARLLCACLREEAYSDHDSYS